VLSMRPSKKERACQWIEGSPKEQADGMIRQLTERGLIG